MRKKVGNKMSEEIERSEFNNDNIYEPLTAYKSVYKDLHHKNVTEYFDSLVEKSQVDVQLNKETNDNIVKVDAERYKVNKQITKITTLKTLMFVLIFAAVIGIFYGVSTIIQSGFDILPFIFVIVGVGIIILSIFLIRKFNPKLKELKAIRNEKDKKIFDLTSQAWEQMRPLNDLLTPELSRVLFSKTLPIINMDKMFTSKRLDYLMRKFGLGEVNNDNHSTLYVQSGDINGNPFFICNTLVHNLGMKTYSGSITIHWTTTSYVNGKSVTNHHTQVLTAEIEKPCPFFSEEPYLVYGNEAAPDLEFSREDSDAELLNEKQIDKLVNKEIKRINKTSEKSISKGGNFTVLGNEEFEVLFGATNRNNEVQFRLLFTPLAQKQLLELMKDKEIGYGDDFDFIKHKMINIIYPEHLRNLSLNMKVDKFHGYDVEVVKNNFIDYNDAYFKSLYFTFAPILAIPLYHQQQPHEYIYKDLYESNVCFYEHECIANKLDINSFKHPESATPNILKTSVLKSDKKCDTVTVTAYGYKTIERVDYIQKFGRDGRTHTIPVKWTEYIPVSQNTDMAINIANEDEETANSNDVTNNKNQENIDQKDIYKMGLFLVRLLRK